MTVQINLTGALEEDEPLAAPVKLDIDKRDSADVGPITNLNAT